MEKKLTIEEIDGKIKIESIGFTQFELVGIHRYCQMALLNGMMAASATNTESQLIEEIKNQLAKNEELQELLNKKTK